MDLVLIHRKLNNLLMGGGGGKKGGGEKGKGALKKFQQTCGGGFF